MPDDLVSVWEVPMKDGVHRVEFEHGTTTGKRVIRLDGKEILRRDWMFKLVGREVFNVGKTACAVVVETQGTFAYSYALEVAGKSFAKFTERQSRSLQTWKINMDGEPTRVCLDKDTMDVWVNGAKMDTAGEFVEDGTETHFEVGKHLCYIKALSTGKRKTGIQMILFKDGTPVPQSDLLN